MLQTYLISTDSGQEGGNARAAGKLFSAKLFDGLDTGLAVCHDARAVLGLNNERDKVLDSSGDTQCFDVKG